MVAGSDMGYYKTWLAHAMTESLKSDMTVTVGAEGAKLNKQGWGPT